MHRIIIKHLLFIVIVSILILGCGNKTSEVETETKTEENDKLKDALPSGVRANLNNQDILSFRYTGWDGVVDERGFYPFDFMYPDGNVNSMKVWNIDLSTGDQNLIVEKEYLENGRISAIKTYAHGDESDRYYYYENECLARIEEGVDGEVVQGRTTIYEYKISDENNVIEKIIHENSTIKESIEKVSENEITLSINNLRDNNSLDLIITFDEGKLAKYITDSGPKFRYKTEFSYIDGKLASITNYNSKEEVMFVHDFHYDEGGNLKDGTSFDHRKDPAIEMRSQKVIESDEVGNWIIKEIYEGNKKVSRIERAITYY